ncbi:hypothetical protein EV359DRAFT_67772 [Lentinula novae-zelandiae]|nr:hypothetical protein EV359DRAFT_67772 [Lentinula novae-zelandiae]
MYRAWSLRLERLVITRDSDQEKRNSVRRERAVPEDSQNPRTSFNKDPEHYQKCQATKGHIIPSGRVGSNYLYSLGAYHSVTANPLFTPQELKNQVETMGVNDADQVESQAMNAPKKSFSIKDACHQISAMFFNCLLTLRDCLSTNLQLAEVLFNLGITSYLLFSVKLLWKLSVMFSSQPHAVGVGFLVPSAALFTFAQLQRYARDQVPTQKNIKEIVGVFEITLTFSRLTF